MKQNIKCILFLLAISALSNFSCRKQIIRCAGNCGTIKVSGNVTNKITNSIATNVPITLDWVSSRICICSQKNVYSTNTSTTGSFNFTSSIDTSWFKDYRLKLKIDNSPDYIALPEFGGIPASSRYMYEYSPDELQNVNFEVYPKANLKIKLNRILKDDFDYFSVQHYFIDNFQFSDYAILSPQGINKTEVNVFTSADIFTKIVSVKRASNGTNKVIIDSIKCTRSGTNIYTVNY